MNIEISINAVSAVALISALVVSANLPGTHALGQVAGSIVTQTPIQKPAWLDGAGKDLRLKLIGQVFDESGAAAHDYDLVASLKTRFGKADLPAVIDGKEFQIWIPVGDAGWFNIYLNATSKDGRRDARETISSFQLRQSAIDGLKLTLKPPERFVDVAVVENGNPVPDAFVVADLLGEPFNARTNDLGIARFTLRNRDQLSQLTAWTKDFRIGGYAFYRDPPRDPLGDRHTIELEVCRPQIVRIINDEGQSLVSDLPFVLTVGTGAPHYQFPGPTPACEMKTDSKGEAVYRWFPDWEKHESYVEILDPRWTKAADEETVDGAIVVKVRKSRFANRKRVVGQVASTAGNVAGFSVEMWSFQGEEKDNSDVLRAFTDENGQFAADYLPGSTYCIFVNDARYVSNIIDLIPYEPNADKTNAPSLTISVGRPVEVAVTSGPARDPMAHQWIHLETPHNYTWLEDGKTRHGSSGRRWWAITDEQGRARTFALPGEKIEGSLSTPEWRSNVSADTIADGVTRLEFHREIAAARKIVGRLLLADNVKADLDQAVIEIGSVDGETNERQTVRANRLGEFEFESKSSRLGIYARTKESKAAAVSLVDNPDQPIELKLKPTAEFRGQLLGREDAPLKEHPVRVTLRVSGKRDRSKSWPTSFSAAVFDSRTDDEGNYLFSGLPCEVALRLSADSIERTGGKVSLNDFYLIPDESRPRTISRMWKPKRTSSFAERYEQTLRDCRLSNFHAMVILFRPSDDAKQFVDVNFMNYRTTREVMSFIQFQEQAGEESPGPEVAELARSKNWPIRERGRIFACAIDPAGRELGRIEIDSKDPAGPKLASEFIRKHAPAQVDAKMKWDEAFAEARSSGRKVWVRISQRYCGPCFSLTRWLDDQKQMLAQDYVFLKIDNVRDLHGEEVAQRLEGSNEHGVPFHAIFNTDGKMLITSESPLGNIGHPSGIEGKKHLRKMLLETRTKLTGQQIDAIVATLSD